ncbi:hypothetical protein C0Q70_09985 [Pomacea canaliculata]|uniref:Uncharacterized protein n=1 Tax=Pomacea canaliculata TaxID=400727 RepID=A0A2T7PBB3_POMCA|nr:hypothetical protein C0Q70_09985 [Pomacea canaliculata]
MPPSVLFSLGREIGHWQNKRLAHSSDEDRARDRRWGNGWEATYRRRAKELGFGSQEFDGRRSSCPASRAVPPRHDGNKGETRHFHEVAEGSGLADTSSSSPDYKNMKTCLAQRHAEVAEEAHRSGSEDQRQLRNFRLELSGESSSHRFPTTSTIHSCD